MHDERCQKQSTRGGSVATSRRVFHQIILGSIAAAFTNWRIFEKELDKQPPLKKIDKQISPLNSWSIHEYVFENGLYKWKQIGEGTLCFNNFAKKRTQKRRFPKH